MYCSKCHKAVNDGSQFCEYCGAQITDLSKKADLSTSKKQDKTAIKLGVLSGANKAVIALNRHFYIDDQKVDAKKILEYESLGIIEWEDDDKSKVIASLIINDESEHNNHESIDHQNIPHKTPEASKSPDKLKNIFSEYSTVIWLSVVGIVLCSFVVLYSAQNYGKLTGKWTSIDSGNTITFSPDNTYHFSIPKQDGYLGYTGDYGTYEVSGDTVTLTPEDSEEETDFNFKVKNDMLSLETDEDGLARLASGNYSK